MRETESRKWLETVLPAHRRLCAAATSLVRNLLDEARIPYLEVSGRPKLLASAVDKIKRKKYKNPKE